MYDLAERICSGKINKANRGFFRVDNYFARIHFLNGIFRLKLNYKIWGSSRWAASVIQCNAFEFIAFDKNNFERDCFTQKKCLKGLLLCH